MNIKASHNYNIHNIFFIYKLNYAEQLSQVSFKLSDIFLALAAGFVLK